MFFFIASSSIARPTGYRPPKVCFVPGSGEKLSCGTLLQTLYFIGTSLILKSVNLQKEKVHCRAPIYVYSASTRGFAQVLQIYIMIINI